MKGMLVMLGLALLAPLAGADGVARATLPNGLRLVVKSALGTDVVAVELLVDVSAYDEPGSKAGIRSLLQRLLLRGTRNETGDSMAQRLSKAAAAVDISVGLDYAELYALVPSDGFEQALTAIADMALNPVFLPEEVERQKRETLEAARAAQEDPFQATYLAVREGLYGMHPYGRSTLGDSSTLTSITREDLVSFHDRFYRPGRAVIAVCGGVTPSRALRGVRAGFGNWTAEPTDVRSRPAVAPLRTSEVTARELTTRRAQLMISFPAPAAGEPGYYEMQMVDSLLCGRSSARLPKLLREKLGIAYHVSSFYPTLAGPSHFVIHVITEPYQLEAAKTAVLEEMANLAREPVPEQELNAVKRYLLGSYALSHLRMKDQAYVLAWYETLGLGPDFEQRYADHIRAVTAAQLRATAQSVLREPLLAVTMPSE